MSRNAQSRWTRSPPLAREEPDVATCSTRGASRASIGADRVKLLSEPERFDEPVIAWRLWGLQLGPAGPAVLPITSSSGAWPARKPLVAECHRYGMRRGIDSPIRVPEFDCTCGVYASDTLCSLASSYQPRGLAFASWPGKRALAPASVVGTVAMWGRVIEHVHGFRSEFAYPDRLRLACGICLADGYGKGIPTKVMELSRTTSAPLSLFPRCAEHLEDPLAGTVEIHEAHAVEQALLDRYAVDLVPFERVSSLFERPPPPASFALVPS